MYAAVERLAEFYQTTHFMAPEFLSVKVVFTSSKNGSTSNQSCPFIAREQKNRSRSSGSGSSFPPHMLNCSRAVFSAIRFPLLEAREVVNAV